MFGPAAPEGVLGIGRSANGHHFFKVVATEFGVEGAYTATRSALFGVDTPKPFLECDVNVAKVRADSTGTSLSADGDRVLVSLLDGIVEYAILAIDRFGFFLDHELDIIRLVTAKVSGTPRFAFAITTDLTSFAGGTSNWDHCDPYRRRVLLR